MKPLYLDLNSHKPLSPKALEAFVKFNNSSAAYGNAMSPSVPGRQAANAIEEARNKIAELIGADSSNQIFFTASCTQACEWAVKILSDVCCDVGKIYVSKAEHPAIRQACSKYINSHKYMNLTKDGTIEPDYFSRTLIDSGEEYDKTFAAVCIHVQNEIGTVQPIYELKYKFNYILSDMSQSLGKMPINLKLFPVDIAVFGAHKFGGPVGVGFIYLKDSSYWQEFGTGSRYFMDRPGSPDAASIVASAAALEEATSTLYERTQKMKDFRDILEPGLEEMGFEIIGKGSSRVSNTTFAYLGEGRGIALMSYLGQKGIHVGLGSACGSSYTGPSPLMKAIGRNNGPNSYIRISHWGEYDGNDAKYFLTALKEVSK